MVHGQSGTENPLMDKIKTHLRTVLLTNYVPLSEHDKNTYVAIYHPRLVSYILQSRLANYSELRQWIFSNENRNNFKQIEQKIYEHINKYLPA